MWSPVRKGLALTVAVIVAGVIRDPSRSHLVPREAFVSLFELAVLLTAVAAVGAGQRERAERPHDRTATVIAGWLGLLYVPVVAVQASYRGVPSWGCGTGRAHAGQSMGMITLLCLFAALALVVLALVRDRDRTRAWRCGALVLAMFASIGLFPVVLDKDRSRPTNHRACYAIQKTIAGAIEMYETDRKSKLPPLTEATFEQLRSGGYLQSVPWDPDVLPRSSVHYQTTTTAPLGITCTWHGPVE